MVYIRNQLNKEQLQAVRHVDGPMLVLAGPGSGKTKVLTERILYLIEEKGIRPDEILVITFSQKAARQMQSRFIALTKGQSYPVNFGTFHAIFYHILMHHHNFSKECILTDRNKQEYIMEIGLRAGCSKATSRSWQNEMLEYISAYKNLGESFLEGDLLLNDGNKEDFINIYNMYIEKCHIEEKLDFDDMIIMCRELLYKHESILRIWQESYKYFLVDEFQDINEAQYDVLRLLAGDSMNVFAVGDDDQSIYAFRGARPELMQKFTKQFYNCRQVYLSVNYRCASNIIGASNELITHNHNRIDRHKQTAFSTESGIVELIDAESTTLQAEYVIDKILEIKDACNLRFEDFAVLYRSAHAAHMIEQICEKRGIPVRGKNGDKTIFDLEEMKLVMSYFKIARNKGERDDFFRIINKPNRNISREVFTSTSKDYFEAMKKYYEGNDERIRVIKELRGDVSFIGTLNPYAGFIYLIKKVKIFGTINGNEQIIECINQIKNFIRDIDTIDVLIDIEKMDINIGNNSLDSSKINKKTGINLMTAHASKGLEFEVVFIIGLQEGIFPHVKNLHGDAVEEERRLMYVAMTRAKKRLYIISVSLEHGKQKSRFIAEIMNNQSFINSYSSLSRNSSNASATASYSSSSSM